MLLPPKLSIQALEAWYGDQPALRGVDLDVAPFGVTALLGPTGAGKSTLLRCINRMHELSPGARARGSVRVRGSVRLDGRELYDPSVDPVMLRRRLGLVAAEPTLFPSMSIRDNVLAGLRMTGQRLGPIRENEIVMRALQEVALWGELRGQLDQRGRGLARGQLQRLCIARALALEPEVLLLDEPCAGLDSLATAKIEDLLHALRSRTTIVLATHDVKQAARVAQHTAFLFEGELIEHASSDVFFTSPEDRRTEDYITGKFS